MFLLNDCDIATYTIWVSCASSVHAYNLRNSASNWHIPRSRIEAATASLHYRGSFLWNKISVEIRDESNQLNDVI